MKLFFFYIDSENKVRKAEQRRVEAAWNLRKPWDKSTGSHALRLLTVAVDDSLQPAFLYLLKLKVKDGWITEESRQDSVLSMLGEQEWAEDNRKSRQVTWSPTMEEHVRALPSNTIEQLAIAIDVPAHVLLKVTIVVGGPLPLSLQMGVSLSDVVKYLD